jgi:hypothetical protein
MVVSLVDAMASAIAGAAASATPTDMTASSAARTAP